MSTILHLFYCLFVKRRQSPDFPCVVPYSLPAEMFFTAALGNWTIGGD